MLKAGVAGAGHLGKIHLRLLQESDQYELMGFYDADPKQAAAIKEEFGYKAYPSLEALIADCDMVDVVTPTLYHFETAKKVIEAGKHLFIEKPITTSMEMFRPSAYKLNREVKPVVSSAKIVANTTIRNSKPNSLEKKNFLIED